MGQSTEAARLCVAEMFAQTVQADAAVARALANGHSR